MHIKLAIIVTVGMFCCFAHDAAVAQITLARADMEAFFGVGSTSLSHTAPDDSIDIGVPSSEARFWDFSRLAFGKPDTLRPVDPLSTPVAALFPGATAAIVESPNRVYAFWRAVDSGLFQLGSVNIGEDTLVNTPPALFVALPLTAAGSWHSRSVSRSSSGVDTVESDGLVDAFGQMKTPDGTFDCLRVKTVQTSWSGTGAHDVYVAFLFFAHGGYLVEIDPSDTIQALAGKFMPTHVGYTHPAGSVLSIKSQTSAPAVVAITVHPNPILANANSEVLIEAPAGASLELVNLLGVTVQAPLLLPAGSGIYSAHLGGAALAPGIYSLRVKTATSITTRTVTVVR